MAPARAGLLCAAVFPLLSGGCGGIAQDDAGAPVTGAQGTLGLVQVERFVDADGASSRLVAALKVARYRNVQGETMLSLLGADSLELERCEVANGLRPASVPQNAEVELLSVGEVSFKAASAETRIEPRVFPLLASAGGWFYALDTVDQAPRVELDEIALRAPGEGGVGAFELAMLAPRDLSEIELDGNALSVDLALMRDHDLALTWSADDPRDRIEVEILAGGSSLLCAARDDGHFLISTAFVSQLEADERAALVLRRVRGAAFDMQRVDVSYATFASTRTSTFTLR